MAHLGPQAHLKADYIIYKNYDKQGIYTTILYAPHAY